jgi:protease I
MEEDDGDTSWPSPRTDLRNAGATRVNEQVVIDNNLVASQKPSDIPVFNQKVIARRCPRPR